MDAREIDLAIGYANMLDGRVTVNEARQDLWAHHLRYMPATACRAAILDYYGQPLRPGERERKPIEPFDIRRLASKHRPRCEDHDEWPADRCLICRDEIADGNRAPELYARKKWPDALEAKPARVQAITEAMEGKS